MSLYRKRHPRSPKIRTASQTGKLSRNKGSAEERRVAKLYEFALGQKTLRELTQYQTSTGRDLRGCQPYAVQCKAGKKVNAKNAYNEALSAVDEQYTLAVAHIHSDHERPLVVLSEEDWITIVERLVDK